MSEIDVVRERLQEVARRRSKTTYGDLGALVMPGLRNPGRSPRLHRILDDVNRCEVERGRGMLSAVVVRKDTGRPGSGFFKLARALGRCSDTEDEIESYCRELEAVYQACQDPRDLGRASPSPGEA